MAQISDIDPWETERGLWLRGADFYRRAVDPECLMAFPGMGLARFPKILSGIAAAPRWSEVAFEDRQLGRIGDDVLVLGYRATAKRGRGNSYRCFCTSTYRRDGERWKLVQHQQTLA